MPKVTSVISGLRGMIAAEEKIGVRLQFFRNLVASKLNLKKTEV
jgi:hypothetical protein